jgi:hypothetical protein
MYKITVGKIVEISYQKGKKRKERNFSLTYFISHERKKISLKKKLTKGKSWMKNVPEIS